MIGFILSRVGYWLDRLDRPLSSSSSCARSSRSSSVQRPHLWTRLVSPWSISVVSFHGRRGSHMVSPWDSIRLVSPWSHREGKE